MSCLLDTNVVLRLADAESEEGAIAGQVLERLVSEGEEIFIGAQVLVEFWSVATRPHGANGFGWPVATAAAAVAELRRQFPVLLETPEVIERWCSLVSDCEVVGKRAHDARLAALAAVHRIGYLLTFNTNDFPAEWGVKAVDPRALVREG